jgi:hypothetical protein
MRAVMLPLAFRQSSKWSGHQDSNLGPSAPKADALPGCAIPRRPASASKHSHILPNQKPKPLVGAERNSTNRQLWKQGVPTEFQRLFFIFRIVPRSRPQAPERRPSRASTFSRRAMRVRFCRRRSRDLPCRRFAGRSGSQTPLTLPRRKRLASTLPGPHAGPLTILREALTIAVGRPGKALVNRPCREAEIHQESVRGPVILARSRRA